jgi:catalase (peroxidase I)
MIINSNNLPTRTTIESIIESDRNLINLKEQIIDSGLTLQEIVSTPLTELNTFLMEYLKLGSLAAKKAAEALQRGAGMSSITK